MAKCSQPSMQKTGSGRGGIPSHGRAKTPERFYFTPVVSTRVPGLLTVHVARPTSRDAELARSRLATTASDHSPPSFASLPLGGGSTCPSPSGTAARYNRTSHL